MVIALVSYLWLCRFASLPAALVGAASMVVIGACDPADGLEVYTQKAMMFAVLSAYAASFVLNSRIGLRWLATAACIAGICAATSLFTKQTVGIATSVVMAVVPLACIFRASGARRATVYLGAFAAGYLLITGIFASHYAHHNALQPFIEQCFLKGPSAKGLTPSSFGLRFITAHFFQPVGVVLAIVAIWFSWPRWRSMIEVESGSTGESTKNILYAAGFAMLSIAVGVLMAQSSDASQVAMKVESTLMRAFAVYTFYGTLALSILLALRWLKNTLSERAAQIFLFASLGFTIAFMVSLSFVFYEAVVVPGLALVLAGAVNGGGKKQYVFIVVAAMGIALATTFKMTKPFYFDGFREAPVKESTAVSRLPELTGFKLPPRMVEFLDETVAIIQSHSKPDEAIYVMPEGGILYALSRRPCAGRSISNNFDTTSELLALEESERLLQSSPAVIVYSSKQREILEMNEAIYRSGKRSNYRKLLDACEQLIKKYKLVKSFQLDPSTNLRVDVYVRP